MIGIYGGTFNPVHYGHLRTALEVNELFELDQLRLIPCRLPPHRHEPNVDGESRLAMLNLAIKEVPGLVSDRRELDREGPSFMVDTLASLRAENPDRCLILFIGADAFVGLERWHLWQHLFDHAHIVVMTRPACQMPIMSVFLRERLCEDRRQLQQKKSGRLFFQAVTALDISATAIRELIAAGRNPQYLLPDAVLAYIRQHQLYLSQN